MIIPTVYNGTEYRSRTEARVAVALDACPATWDWVWEPEGFKTPIDGGYLPDFLAWQDGRDGNLSTPALYIEVKGDEYPYPMLWRDLVKLRHVAVESGRWVCLLRGLNHTGTSISPQGSVYEGMGVPDFMFGTPATNFARNARFEFGQTPTYADCKAFAAASVNHVVRTPA